MYHPIIKKMNLTKSIQATQPPVPPKPKVNPKVETHKEICKELNGIYERKNNDYGDSFSKLRSEVPNQILVRLYDKYSRLKSLMSGTEQQVKDENIEDTLMDLANYAIMELIEMRGKNE